MKKLDTSLPTGASLERCAGVVRPDVGYDDVADRMSSALRPSLAARRSGGVTSAVDPFGK
jgi:hypothetical protein